ncbi:MAG: lipoyl protein ligase domain-containing protein, partial [Candidatus Krumholzibacteriia bacterium]
MGRPTSLRIFDDGPLPGAVNMRRDAALLAARRAGEPPVLRLYRWAPPAVSYGYHQSEADFDAAAIAARGFGLVRRPTGGRAILHAEELTYAVVGDSPGPLFGGTLHETYAAINAALLRFLRD